MDERILIVEDDEEIARIIRDHLKRSGYEVNWASTGLEGLEDFKRDKYDLILVDIMLPEMDGFTLCKNIRLLNDVPILIISAKNTIEDKVNGLKLGADDYITKPFSLWELEARVESNLRRSKGFEKCSLNTYRYRGGLSINKGKMEVALNNEIIPLTSKEFDLLILMLQNPGRVFSKKELYENVWAQSDIDGSNTVTVHIKAIREKLKDDIKNPTFIQTVWGSGYKFIGELIS